MPPVPKKRRSTQRQGKIRAKIKLRLPNLVPCPSCGALKLPHHYCPECNKLGHEKKK